MQMKNKMRYHSILTRTQTKIEVATCVGKGAEKLEPSYIAEKMIKWLNSFGK